jgi:hypothetical protein
MSADPHPLIDKWRTEARQWREKLAASSRRVLAKDKTAETLEIRGPASAAFAQGIWSTLERAAGELEILLGASASVEANGPVLLNVSDFNNRWNKNALRYVREQRETALNQRAEPGAAPSSQKLEEDKNAATRGDARYSSVVSGPPQPPEGDK